MNESTAVIDIEATEVTTDSHIETPIESKIDVNRSEPNLDLLSIWVASAQARELTNLDKSAFQRSMSALLDNYKVPIDLLRRGEGRNTQYSSYAIELVKAIRTGDKASIEKLLAFTPQLPQQNNSSALALTNQNTQLARQNDSKAIENFSQARQVLNAGMKNWRMLGASLAQKVTTEIKAGFAEEFNSQMQDLGMQAQDVFNVE